MKVNWLISSCFFVLLLGMAKIDLPAQTEGSGLRSQEVLVDIRYPGQTVRMILIGVEEGELVLRTVGPDRGERAYLDRNELRRQGTTLWFIMPADYQRALTLSRSAEHREAREIFRRLVTPLLPYLDLGPVAGNLIQIVDAWIESSIALQDWDEAVSLAARLDLETVDRTIFARVINLARSLHREEADLNLNRLEASLLRIRNPNAMHRSELLRLGHFWRENRLFHRAAQLYAKVESSSGPEAREAALWTLFTQLFSNQLVPQIEGTTFASRPADRDFTLELLIQARLSQIAGEPTRAMRLAAEAFAYSGPEETPHPEILLLLGELYRTEGEIEIAAQIYRQGELLYPGTLWEQSFLRARETLLPASS